MEKAVSNVHLMLYESFYQMDEKLSQESEDSSDSKIFQGFLNARANWVIPTLDYIPSSEDTKETVQYFVKINSTERASATLESICVASDAQLRCIGMKQAEMSSAISNNPFQAIESTLSFKFGTRVI